jgi:hypothetical protein
LTFYGGEGMIMFLIMQYTIVLNLKTRFWLPLVPLTIVLILCQVLTNIKGTVSRWRGLVGELLSEIE